MRIHTTKTRQTSFMPPKQKIWLVLAKPYCLVANQKQEFCD